jgi:general secretion pathway protein L
MAEFLVIRLGDSQQAPANWIAVDSSGARRSPPVIGPLHEACADIGERSVIVLVSSVDVLTTTVDIPIRGGVKLQAALPYALEESLADDVDKLHFAAGTRRSSGQVPVSVVDREKLAGWLSWLREAGIEPSSMVAESYGLARIPGTISLIVAENQVVINDGADIELVMQSVSPGDALADIGAFDEGTGEHDEQSDTLGMPRHVLVYCAPEDEERYQHDWIAMRQELDSLDVKLLADGVLPRLAVTVATGAGVNLLQGEYGRKTDFLGMFEPWKYAAMLLLAFGLVAVGGKAADFYGLKQQHANLQQQFLLEYQQIVPGAALPRDPAAAVQSLLVRSGKAQAPQIFLRSLEHLSQAIQQNQSAAIEAINFRAGVVDVRLTAPDVTTLDSIQKSVSQSGQFEATIQSTTQDGDKLKSRIQIQAGGK